MVNLEGSLDERRLSTVLLRLARAGRTGVLTVQAEREIISIYLLDGQIVSADALNQSLEDGLGSLLAERGLVGPEEYAGLAAEHQAGGGRVSDLLVERRYLSRTQLLQALRQHNYQLSRQALAWREGQYKFYRGEEVTHEEGIAPMPVEELLVRAAHDSGAAQEARPPGPGVIYELTASAPRLDAAAVVGESVPAELMPDELGADAVEILALVDARRSAAEIAAHAGVSEFRVSYCCHRWEQEGFLARIGQAPGELVAPVEIEPAPEEPAPAAPAEPEPAKPRRSSWLRRLFTPRERPATVDLLPWPGRVLALTAAIGLLGLALVDPISVLLPFPWQAELRRAHAQDQLASVHLRIRQAAGTFFLIYGHYPDDLSRLVELGLLEASDLVDPSGMPFRYSATSVSYLVRTAGEDEPLAEGGRGESIAGNFLLDPDYAVGESSAEAPLVLLD